MPDDEQTTESPSGDEQQEPLPTEPDPDLFSWEERGGGQPERRA